MCVCVWGRGFILQGRNYVFERNCAQFPRAWPNISRSKITTNRRHVTKTLPNFRVRRYNERASCIRRTFADGGSRPYGHRTFRLATVIRLSNFGSTSTPAVPRVPSGQYCRSETFGTALAANPVGPRTIECPSNNARSVAGTFSRTSYARNLASFFVLVIVGCLSSLRLFKRPRILYPKIYTRAHRTNNAADNSTGTTYTKVHYTRN